MSPLKKGEMLIKDNLAGKGGGGGRLTLRNNDSCSYEDLPV